MTAVPSVAQHAPYSLDVHVISGVAAAEAKRNPYATAHMPERASRAKNPMPGNPRRHSSAGASPQARVHSAIESLTRCNIA